MILSAKHDVMFSRQPMKIAETSVSLFMRKVKQIPSLVVQTIAQSMRVRILPARIPDSAICIANRVLHLSGAGRCQSPTAWRGLNEKSAKYKVQFY